jgi:hypothetical protein
MSLQNPFWWLVIASAICVVGIVVAFKQMVSSISTSGHLEETELRSQVSREFQRFILKIAYIEAVPIIIICFSMFQILGIYPIVAHPVIQPVIPLIVLLLIMAFGWINVFLTRVQTLQDPQLSDSVKQYVVSHSILALAFVNAIPLISSFFCVLVLTGSVK